MKFIPTTAFAVILALAGASLARAQEPEPDKEKQKQQEEEKKKQPKEQPKADERKTQPGSDKEKEKQDVDRQKQQTNEREDKKKADQRQYSSTGNANSQGGDRRNAHKIPQERFQASFGREHHFRVQKRDDRHFEYGGYTFEYVEAWPAAWSWDDDCYIELDGDTYYLVDLTHPGIRLELVVIG